MVALKDVKMVESKAAMSAAQKAVKLAVWTVGLLVVLKDDLMVALTVDH